MPSRKWPMRTLLKATAIVQARMGSQRLPGKVLLDLGGAKTVLGRVVQRLRRALLLDNIVVATTVLGGDDVIEQECKRLGVECFRDPVQTFSTVITARA